MLLSDDWRGKLFHVLGWKKEGKTLPDAMPAILQKTGKEVHVPASNKTFRRLDVVAALEHVLLGAEKEKKKP